MDQDKVIKQLKQKYPNCNIIKNDKHNPTEIICEVDPTSNHKDYSIAIAVIDKSLPHVHKETEETYKVLKGNLTVYIDNKQINLKKGDSIVIKPKQKHWAEGKESWVKCYSKPGWTFEDHILL